MSSIDGAKCIGFAVRSVSSMATVTSSSGFGYGSGRNNAASMTLKSAVERPMPERQRQAGKDRERRLTAQLAERVLRRPGARFHHAHLRVRRSRDPGSPRGCRTGAAPSASPSLDPGRAARTRRPASRRGSWSSSRISSTVASCLKRARSLASAIRMATHRELLPVQDVRHRRRQLPPARRSRPRAAPARFSSACRNAPAGRCRSPTRSRRASRAAPCGRAPDRAIPLRR